ncbi:uncharacterized protein LOC120446605 isoform X3 [Drosophila santomea]|uniref:uncharacterized protein LOC120446605 isoform X3 n=1 Tax=Drosophila santomea TaxID=129105 RepID=UPI00195393BE|nr:uncharacterized protein LOC120446605 isoform X3 [Drosophila santomea]
MECSCNVELGRGMRYLCHLSCSSHGISVVSWIRTRAEGAPSCQRKLVVFGSWDLGKPLTSPT